MIGVEHGIHLYEASILSIEHRNLYNTHLRGIKIWLSIFMTATVLPESLQQYQKALNISKSPFSPPISPIMNSRLPLSPIKIRLHPSLEPGSTPIGVLLEPALQSIPYPCFGSTAIRPSQRLRFSTLKRRIFQSGTSTYCDMVYCIVIKPAQIG